MYRMLAGRLPFDGPTAADTVAQVLQSAPDLSLLRPQVPDALVRLLRRCLEKESRLRVQHAGDLRILIEEALVPLERAGDSRPAWVRPMIAIAGTAALAGLATVLWFEVLRGTAHEHAGPVRAELSFESTLARNFPLFFRRVAIARDGSRIAVSTGSELWIRSLDATRSVHLDVVCVNPFFSPDGAWVGCFSDAGIVKIPADGGAAVPVAPITERNAGAAWCSDGSILVATSEGLFRVNEKGGKPELIVRPDAARGDRQYAWPELLPGERAVLLTVLSRQPGVPPRLVRLDLDRRSIDEVLEGGSSARYMREGVLVYASGRRLFAVRWDAQSNASLRDALPVPQVQLDPPDGNGAASYAVSANGTLVTLVTPPDASRGRVLYWRDLHGVETPIDVPAGSYGYPRVSPDGKRVALDIPGSDNRDIWILELERSSLARMTTDVAEDNLPAWSSDGRRVFFSSNRGGDFDIYSQAADASDVARREVAAPGPQIVLDVSPDGRHIVAVEEFRRLSVFDTDSDSLRPLLSGGAVYWNGSISPDGKWIAYESDESGERIEILVRPFPAVTGRRERISISGGRYPVWGPRNSHALYFVQPDGAMMRAQLRLDPELQLGPVTRLFEWTKPLPSISGVPYDVSQLDGRFLLTRPVATQTAGAVRVELVLNWFDELQRLVPE
jgi:serine/threonine-protein kinase